MKLILYTFMFLIIIAIGVYGFFISFNNPHNLFIDGHGQDGMSQIYIYNRTPKFTSPIPTENILTAISIVNSQLKNKHGIDPNGSLEIAFDLLGDTILINRDEITYKGSTFKTNENWLFIKKDRLYFIPKNEENTPLVINDSNLWNFAFSEYSNKLIP